jgi:uncharacterized protein YodC (DUF2158 family)
MKAEDFSIGDVVRLHSSSTKMTVSKIVPGAADEIICHWFNEQDELQEFPFSVKELVILKKSAA